MFVYMLFPVGLFSVLRQFRRDGCENTGDFRTEKCQGGDCNHGNQSDNQSVLHDALPFFIPEQILQFHHDIAASSFKFGLLFPGRFIMSIPSPCSSVRCQVFMSHHMLLCFLPFVSVTDFGAFRDFSIPQPYHSGIGLSIHLYGDFIPCKPGLGSYPPQMGHEDEARTHEHHDRKKKQDPHPERFSRIGSCWLHPL